MIPVFIKIINSPEPHQASINLRAVNVVEADNGKLNIVTDIPDDPDGVFVVDDKIDSSRIVAALKAMAISPKKPLTPLAPMWVDFFGQTYLNLSNVVRTTGVYQDNGVPCLKVFFHESNYVFEASHAHHLAAILNELSSTGEKTWQTSNPSAGKRSRATK